MIAKRLLGLGTLAGGTTGRAIIDRFIPEAAKHLKPTGHIS